MAEKWKRLKTERVFDSRFFRVNKDTVRLPGGREIEWFYWDSTDSAMVVAQTADGRLVMIRQYRYLPDCEVIEFPSGSVKSGEDLLRGALRELEEETGYSCSKIVKIGEFYETYGNLNRKIHIFYGEDAARTKLKKSPDRLENIKTELVDFDKAVELALDNKIIAAGSSLAVLLLNELKKKGKLKT